MGRAVLCLAAACVVLVAFSAVGAGEARAADWEWTIAPYIWASGLSADVTANDEPVIGADASFSDLVDKTDMAAMIHFEGRAGKTGFFVDLLYLDLGDEEETIPSPPLPGGTTVESQVTMGIYDAGGMYRFMGDERVLDLLFGVRMLALEQEHDISVPAPFNQTTTLERSDNLVDGFLGARYRHPIGTRWDFMVRGDIGAGDTEFTWNAVALAGVRFGKTDRYSLRFGWREMESEIEGETDRGVDLDTDLNLSGPIIGFIITL